MHGNTAQFLYASQPSVLSTIQNLIDENDGKLNKLVFSEIKKLFNLDKYTVYDLANNDKIKYERTLRTSEEVKELEQDIKSLLENSETYLSKKDLAKIFDISEWYVNDLLDKIKPVRKVEYDQIKHSKNCEKTREVTADLIEEYFNNHPTFSYRVMSNYFGCSPQTLVRRVKKANKLDLHQRIISNGRNQHSKKGNN